MSDSHGGFEGITVFASESDCLAGAPEPYESLMRYLHFITFPLYMLSLYVLIFRTPISLREYRKYLIWHTLGNLISELYISILYLPVPYSPQTVLRGAGLLKYFNINGYIQFWILVTTVVHTGLSIIEMFKYRFDAMDCEPSLNKKIIHRTVLFFWVNAIVIVVLCLGFTPFMLPEQHRLRQQLWKENHNLAIGILCYTSNAPVKFNEPVIPTIMILISIEFITAIVTILHMTLAVLRKLEELSKHMSKKTVNLHKVLLLSLFTQAMIHLILLGIPIGGFVFIVYLEKYDELAPLLLIFVSYHGSVSTIGMIVFTKPIRLGVVEVFDQCLSSLCRTKKKITVTNQLPSESLSDSNRISTIQVSVH